MSAVILNIDTIVSDPTVRSGRPTIAGTGICVSDVVIAHETGDQLTPEQMAENFRLNLGEVYAALSYYHLHKSELDAEIEASSNQAQQLLEKLANQGKLLNLE